MSSISLIQFIVILTFYICSVASQQAYAPSSCDRSTSAPGYACNGMKESCQTYFIYRAQPPYKNASSIATLLGCDPRQITAINNISDSDALATGKEVIVPISCSCSGAYYQFNSSYVVEAGDTPSLIANNTFQGLTTCTAIQSGLDSTHLVPDERLVIPLRCACPTKNQSDLDGTKYLMTYVVKPGDSVSPVSLRFHADDGETLEANQKSEEDSVIHPFTTLLLPLRGPPNSSMTYTPPPTPPPPSPPSVSQNTKKKWNYFVYGMVAGGGFVLLILGAVVICFVMPRLFKKRATKVNWSDDTETKSHIGVELLDNISNIAQTLTLYSFKDLHSATNNFSRDVWIGGSVYRGTLNEEQQQRQVAVKRTNTDVSKEIDILNKINHFNITKLYGMCYNDGLWYLVYEYVANGPLSNWIYQSSTKNKCLSWIQRVQISLDVAMGLEYLHNYTSPPHVHRDLRCNHVLLDGEFRAKISHFGLSKSVEGGKFALTEHIVGTKGYMAPEYVENGLVTPKMDVYAFGILVVEILSGREVSGPPLGDKDVDEESMRSLMDPGLLDTYPVKAATSIVRLAQRCVQKEPSGRPRMDEAVTLLSKALTSSLLQDSISSHTATTSAHSDV